MDDIEIIETAGYKLGEITGIEFVIKFLSDRAGEKFIAGDDDLARHLRGMAIEMKMIALDMRRNYNEKIRPGRGEAYKHIENRSRGNCVCGKPIDHRDACLPDVYDERTTK